MENNEVEKSEPAEYPEAWWYKIYVAVLVTTVVVIAALWTFSRYFA